MWRVRGGKRSHLESGHSEARWEGQAMEHLGSGLSWQEGPENSSLAWSRVP